jgi:hypothetical protein
VPGHPSPRGSSARSRDQIVGRRRPEHRHSGITVIPSRTPPSLDDSPSLPTFIRRSYPPLRRYSSEDGRETVPTPPISTRLRVHLKSTPIIPALLPGALGPDVWSRKASHFFSDMSGTINCNQLLTNCRGR